MESLYHKLPIKTVKNDLKDNCSGGCPCSDFDCLASTSVPATSTTAKTTTAALTTTITTTTTSIALSGSAVLVLNTLASDNERLIVDFDGKL